MFKTSATSRDKLRPNLTKTPLVHIRNLKMQLARDKKCDNHLCKQVLRYKIARKIGRTRTDFLEVFLGKHLTNKISVHVFTFVTAIYND